MSQPPVDRRRLVKAFWLAVGISVLCNLIQPWGRYALYPFALLATWTHEMGHGLTSLILGGDFRTLELFANLGGQARVTAFDDFFRGPLVSMGGLLGPAVVGGGVIVLGARSERSARVALWLFVAALATSLVVWIRPFFDFGMFAIGVVTVGLGAAAAKGGPFVELLLTQLIGIQLCLGSLGDVDYMFTKGFERDGKHMVSDTGAIAEHWLLPYWVWGALIAAISFLILAAAFYVAWIKPFRKQGGAKPASA